MSSSKMQKLVLIMIVVVFVSTIMVVCVNSPLKHRPAQQPNKHGRLYNWKQTQPRLTNTQTTAIVDVDVNPFEERWQQIVKEEQMRKNSREKRQAPLLGFLLQTVLSIAAQNLASTDLKG